MADEHDELTAEAPESLENEASEADTSIRAFIAAAMQGTDDESAPAAEQPGDEEPESEEVGAAELTDDDDEPGPPKSWTEAEREAWHEMPRSAQDAILRRERDYSNGLRVDREVHKVLEPVAEALKDTGMHLDEYVAGLVQADQFIGQQPLEAALAIIERHGLRDQIARHLGSPSEKTTSAESQPRQNGAEADRIAKLEQQIEYQNALHEAQREWDAFTREHPDANDLREIIASKIGSNPRLSYADAYQAATKMVRELGGSITAAEERAEVEASQRKRSKAQRLNLPRGRSETGTKPASSGNLRDDIRQAMRTAGYTR